MTPILASLHHLYPISPEAEQAVNGILMRGITKKAMNRTRFIVDTCYRLGKMAQVENRVMAQFRNMAFRLTPDSVNEKQVARVLDA